MGLCRRLCVIIRKASPYSLQRPVPFSSTGSAGSPRTSDSFPEDSDGGGGSAVYRRALKFQRPTVIKWQDRLYNSVSFIGTVELPVKITATRHGSFGVHTMLSVKTSRESNHTLRIFLKMWDNLAEIAIKHLKPNDFIYVSGSLGSYEKSDANGKLRIYYEVTVKELNYVVPRGQGQISQKYENSESRGTILKCIDAGYFQMMTLKQVFLVWKRRKTAFICGRFILPTRMSGGITGKINQIRVFLILSIRILVKLFGLVHMILHGLKDNSNCMIQEWQEAMRRM